MSIGQANNIRKGPSQSCPQRSSCSADQSWEAPGIQLGTANYKLSLVSMSWFVSVECCTADLTQVPERPVVVRPLPYSCCHALPPSLQPCSACSFHPPPPLQHSWVYGRRHRLPPPPLCSLPSVLPPHLRVGPQLAYRLYWFQRQLKSPSFTSTSS